VWGLSFQEIFSEELTKTKKLINFSSPKFNGWLLLKKIKDWPSDLSQKISYD
jgi:hypothetical protein